WSTCRPPTGACLVPVGPEAGGPAGDRGCPVAPPPNSCDAGHPAVREVTKLVLPAGITHRKRTVGSRLASTVPGIVAPGAGRWKGGPDCSAPSTSPWQKSSINLRKNCLYGAIGRRVFLGPLPAGCAGSPPSL